MMGHTSQHPADKQKRPWAKTANDQITILPHSSSNIIFVYHIFQAILIIFPL